MLKWKDIFIEKNVHERAFIFLSLMLFFTLPLQLRINGIIIGLLFVNWLIEGKFRDKFSKLFRNKIALLFIALYTLTVLGFIYSCHPEIGLKKLETKMAFLFLPLIIGSSNGRIKSTFFLAFVAGSILLLCFFWGKNTIHYFQDCEYFFFGSQAFNGYHIGYLSTYFLTSIILLQFNQSRDLKLSPAFTYTLILLLALGIILTTAKMPLIILVLILVFYTIKFTIELKRKWIPLSVFTILVIIGSFMLSKNSKFEAKFNQVKTFLTTNQLNDKEATGSTVERYFLWKSSWDIIKQNPIAGVGTGGADIVINTQMKSNGYLNAAEKVKNAHNQYLQNFVSVGFLGFFVLVYILYQYIKMGVKKKSSLILMLTILFSITMLTESFLEREAGILLFTLMLLSTSLFTESIPLEN